MIENPRNAMPSLPLKEAKGKLLSSGEWKRQSLRAVPELVVSNRLQKTTRYNPENRYKFRYRSREHRDLPHVMKFSGGRSSGMLLFILLENGILKPERGDVIIFNNTSCEHPDTYRFVAECKHKVENHYGIPFFWIEFQTYEDARRGNWTRLPSYRMVNDKPVSDSNPGGFRWNGEVFEELLSHNAYVPNQFRRICTATLKLEATRLFLQDWFAGKEGISRLGHQRDHSRIDPDVLYKRHVNNRGGVPREIYLRKKAYVLGCPPFRPEQRFGDFSGATAPFENSTFDGKIFGNNAWFGSGGIEYIAFIGLRGDEQQRVARVEARSADIHSNPGYEGEHVYMPFADMRVTEADVNCFWELQDWGLKLPRSGALSNCVFCFLKGVGNLKRVHEQMERRKKTSVRGFGSTVDTPCDIAWWVRMEEKYGRDLVAENRERTGNGGVDFIGFFGGSTDFSYRTLATSKNEGADLSRYANAILPCDCTD